MWKVLAAYVVLGLGGVVAGGESNPRPEGVRYEVRYFHAAQRDGNCRDAEAWAREEVDAIASAKGEGSVVFSPADMEKQEDLARAYKIKQMDVLVAEIKDGKAVRVVNLGNLLSLVKGKKEDKAQAAVRKFVRDGLVKFDANAVQPWLTTPAKAKSAWPTARPKVECCEPSSCCPN